MSRRLERLEAWARQRRERQAREAPRTGTLLSMDEWRDFTTACGRAQVEPDVAAYWRWRRGEFA